jgi:hypothetical protein
MLPGTFLRRYGLQMPAPRPQVAELPERAPYTKLTRVQLLRRIGRHVKFSPMQLGWTTHSLRYVLESYEPEA